MAGLFDWTQVLTGQGGDNPSEAIGNWADAQRARNRQALGLDANGNPLPAGDPNAAPADPNAAASTGQALAGSQQSPDQQPNATKTDPSLGHLMMNLTQYQQREQGFNQALGMGFAAFSQPRDRQMVSQMFNVNEPDVNKIGQTQMDLASQQQGQDRTNALGQMLTSNDPRMVAQANQIAQSLNIPLADLKARYLADPAGVGAMIQNFRQPTDQMKNLQQIQSYLQGQPGATSKDIGLLTPSLIAAVGPDFAQKAIGDAISYRQTHGGKDAPWVGPGGINVDVYNRYNATQKNISDTQDTARTSLEPNLQTTDTLRTKLSDLQNNAGLAKILAAPADSPLKTAAWNAINSHDPNWQSTFIQNALVNDPSMLAAISEIREIQGQEYTGALHSLLGHGLRPTQAEIDSVRDGFGQTRNIASFGSIKDYSEQAIKPLLTRLDEAQAEGYGSAGRTQDAPERLRPFIGKSYLTGGGMHLDDGQAAAPWENQVHKPVPPDVAAAAQAAIAKQPKNAFAVRDGLRRQGYDVDF